jgi:hypothetical protein
MPSGKPLALDRDFGKAQLPAGVNRNGCGYSVSVGWRWSHPLRQGDRENKETLFKSLTFKP